MLGIAKLIVLAVGGRAHVQIFGAGAEVFQKIGDKIVGGLDFLFLLGILAIRIFVAGIPGVRAGLYRHTDQIAADQFALTILACGARRSRGGARVLVVGASGGQAQAAEQDARVERRARQPVE